MKVIVSLCLVLLLAYYAQGMVLGVALDNADDVDVPTKGLCTPAQWEGFSSSWYPELDTLAFANISYDFTNKKLAIDVEKWVWHDDDKESKSYSMIFRFDKKKAYFFHDREDGKNCTVRELEHEFMEWCVPKDAKCMGPFTIGGSLKVNAYRFNISHHSAAKTEDSTWMYYENTMDGIPVTAKYGSEKVSGVSDYYDITGGIDNENRFDPPEFCNHVQPTPWRHDGHKGGKRAADNAFSLWHMPYRV